LIFIK
jgi:hypothetical protein